MTSRVSESEIRVMEVLWQTSPLTASEVIDKLDDTRWNEKTVKTFLNRLLKKNAIGFKKDGRKYAYFPLIEREQLLKQESAGFLDKLFGGDVKELLATFVQNKQLSEEELTYLRNLLDEQNQGDKQ